MHCKKVSDGLFAIESNLVPKCAGAFTSFGDHGHQTVLYCQSDVEVSSERKSPPSFTSLCIPGSVGV